MNIRINIYIMIVVSFILTTIVSCSSRTMDKTKSKEETAVKETEKEDSSSSTVVSKDETESTSIIRNNTTFGEDLTIVYDPTFDSDGKLIPFKYVKTENGKTTQVDITGTAKVINNTKVVKEDISEQTVKNIKKEIDSLVNIKVDRVKDSLASHYKFEKKVEVKPDYFKYLIWIGIAMLLLTAIVIGLYFYFKTTIGKYKNIIDKFTGNDT